MCNRSGKYKDGAFVCGPCKFVVHEKCTTKLYVSLKLYEYDAKNKRHNR